MSILFCKAANLVKHFERFLYFIYRKLVSPAGLHLLVGAGPDLAGPRVSIYCLFFVFYTTALRSAEQNRCHGNCYSGR